MPEDENRIAGIDQRWGQLHALESEYAAAGLKFVFLSNAGGAIATLSFIGSSPIAAASKLVIWTLIVFIAGVILYGLSVVTVYFRIVSVFEGYRADVQRAFENHISIQELQKRDIDRAGNFLWLDHLLPLSGFACFVIGCILGGVALA